MSKDKKLRPYIDKIELPPRKPSSDIYSGLISSIVSQQLSVKAASTIQSRFIGLFKAEYPIAENWVKLSDTDIRNAGLSGKKNKVCKKSYIILSKQ